MTKNLEQFLDMLPEPNRSGCKHLLVDNQERFSKSPGSKTKHQAWKGGYIDHITDMLNFGEHFYETLGAMGRPLPFTFVDAIIPIFLHDLEKPFKYVAPKTTFMNDEEKLRFILKKVDEYRIELTDAQFNAIHYVHGEGTEYNPTERIQQPLAAFVHCCDTVSARIFFDYPKK